MTKASRANSKESAFLCLCQRSATGGIMFSECSCVRLCVHPCVRGR